MVKKILIISGVIFIALIVSGGLVCLSDYVGGSFLSNLLGKDLLSIMVTLLGLNIASTTFFMSNIMNLEQKYNFYFDKTRSEIRDNLIIMAISVVLYFLVGLLSPNNGIIYPTLFFVLKTISVALFLIEVMAVVELTVVLTRFKTPNTGNSSN